MIRIVSDTDIGMNRNTFARVMVSHELKWESEALENTIG